MFLKVLRTFDLSCLPVLHLYIYLSLASDFLCTNTIKVKLIDKKKSVNRHQTLSVSDLTFFML